MHEREHIQHAISCAFTNLKYRDDRVGWLTAHTKAIVDHKLCSGKLGLEHNGAEELMQKLLLGEYSTETKALVLHKSGFFAKVGLDKQREHFATCWESLSAARALYTEKHAEAVRHQEWEDHIPLDHPNLRMELHLHEPTARQVATMLALLAQAEGHPAGFPRIAEKLCGMFKGGVQQGMHQTFETLKSFKIKGEVINLPGNSHPMRAVALTSTDGEFAAELKFLGHFLTASNSPSELIIYCRDMANQREALHRAIETFGVLSPLTDKIANDPKMRTSESTLSDDILQYRAPLQALYSGQGRSIPYLFIRGNLGDRKSRLEVIKNWL